MLHYKTMRWWLIAGWISCCLSIGAQVDYHTEIAPIISQHCESCHSPGDIGPMSLGTYDEVSSYASMIKYVTDVHLMPPFKADTRYVTYANERSLSPEEQDLISRWIEGGLVEGAPVATLPGTDDLPASRNVEYDYTVCMSTPFEHYGIYYDQYQVFVLPMEQLAGNKYIKEIYFKPGNKEIVRSCNLSVATAGQAKMMDKWDPRYGYFAYGDHGFNSRLPNWHSWMPHTTANRLREGERLYLPKSSELLMHIHYGPYGEIQYDSSCVHFVFDDTPGTIIQNVPLIHPDLLADTFFIEKDKKRRITSSYVLPVDVKLRSVTPLAHLLCRGWEVFAVLPDKNSIPLLKIDDWDFHWKEKYIFEDYLSLPAGTRIIATATYDNTAANPYNPADPPHTMKKGPHMYDENHKLFFEFAPPAATGSYLIKPFVIGNNSMSQVSFHISESDTIELTLYSIDDQTKATLSARHYLPGTHTIRSSDLPSSQGRYCITLTNSEGMVDYWWLVIL